MNPYLLAKHLFCLVSHVHLSGLQLSFVISLHGSILTGAFVDAFVGAVVGAGFSFSPKKNHQLKKIIAPGINMLNTTCFTILYWKLRADDIFAILLYIIPDILFSWNTIFKQLNTSYQLRCSPLRVELSYRNLSSLLLHRLDQ
jgi:hypothetical protein